MYKQKFSRKCNKHNFGCESFIKNPFTLFLKNSSQSIIMNKKSLRKSPNVSTTKSNLGRLTGLDLTACSCYTKASWKMLPSPFIITYLAHRGNFVRLLKAAALLSHCYYLRLQWCVEEECVSDPRAPAANREYLNEPTIIHSLSNNFK